MSVTEPLLHAAVLRRLRSMTLEVDIQFGSGVTALVGPSGAGKSTLLRIIAGLVRPDNGIVHLNGASLDDVSRRLHLPPGRRNISLVFQEYALFPHLSVARNVRYGLAARGVPRAERRRRVQTMLARLDIADLADERPGRLSGGQRQRVALARALVVQPRALLLDEPLAALDVQTRSAVRTELRDVLADLAIPTLLVTHDYTDALVFHQRIVILAEGRVVQDGTHADLLAHPRSRFVADFTGVNFYEGILERHDPDRLGRVRLTTGDEVFVAADGVSPGHVTLSLHPWEITLASDPPAGSARNVLTGRVREIMPLGGRIRVLLAAGASNSLPLVAEITLEAQEVLRCREGQALYAAFKATAFHLGSGST